MVQEGNGGGSHKMFSFSTIFYDAEVYLLGVCKTQNTRARKMAYATGKKTREN
jgi:hypothetical protein